MKISIRYDFLPKHNSTNAAFVMDHFGVGFEQGQHTIADGLEIPFNDGEIICFTGASGSGKSSLMRATSAQLDDVINIDSLDLGNQILVERLACPIEESLRLLSSCGLSEAQLMLRTPAELSDGQRYRFRLALAISMQPQWILADEFTATLDRTLAKVLAFNLSRTAKRTGIGFLLATTHEDIVDDLSPQTHVQCDLNNEPKITTSRSTSEAESNAETDRKKKASASQKNCDSVPQRDETGRTFLGGITAATTLGLQNSQCCFGTVRDQSASACSHHPHSACDNGIATSV